MVKIEFPSKVSQSLQKYINSVWHLELMLFLESNTKPMTSREIANTLYLSPDAIENALSKFEKNGILKSIDNGAKSYIYGPKDSDLDDAIKQTARAYAERRVAIINQIFASPLQSFSDAFRLSEEKENQ